MEKLSASAGSMQTGSYCSTGAAHSAPRSKPPRFCYVSSSLPWFFGSLQSTKLSRQKLLRAEQCPSQSLSTRPRGSVTVDAVRVSRDSGTGLEEKALRPGLATVSKRTPKLRKKEDTSSEINEFKDAGPKPRKMATFRVAEAAEMPDRGAQQTVDYYSTHMEQLLGRGKKHGRPKAVASPSKKAAGKSRAFVAAGDIDEPDIDVTESPNVSDTERQDRGMQNGRRLAGKNGCLRLRGDDGCLRSKWDDGCSKQGGVLGSGSGSTTTWPLDVLESRNERVLMEVKGEVLESLNTWKRNRRRSKEAEGTRVAEACSSGSSGGADARPPGRRNARVEISGSPFLTETPESDGASSVDADRSGPSESADAKLPSKLPRRSVRNARATVETSPLPVWEEESTMPDPEGASSAEASGSSSSQTAGVERPLAESTNRGRSQARSAATTEVLEGERRAEDSDGASSAESERPEASEKGAGPANESGAQKSIEGGGVTSAQKASEAASKMTLLFVEDGNEKVGSRRRRILKAQGREGPQTESEEASDSGAEPQSASQSRETSASTRTGHSQELEQEAMKEGDDGREKSRTRGSNGLEGKSVRALAHKSNGTKGQASKVKPVRRKKRRLEGEDVFKDSPLRKVLKRCERCHEGKDLADYTRTVSTADGFNPFCRACHAAINAERRGKTLPQETMEGNQCIDCKRVRPAIEFAMMRSLPSGLKVRCRACDSLQQAVYRDRMSACEVEVTHQQCGGCGETKPISGFGKHRGLKWGHDTYCKLCQRERFLAWKAERRPLLEPIVKQKRCTVCEETKAAGEFSLSINSFDGLQSRCRECVLLLRKQQTF